MLKRPMAATLLLRGNGTQVFAGASDEAVNL